MRSNIRLAGTMFGILIIALPLIFILQVVAMGNLAEAIRQTIIVFAVFLLSVVFIGALRILGVRASEETAQAIEDWAVGILSSYRVLYLEHLISSHQDFDTRGLTVQGEHSLALNHVYVELKLKEYKDDGNEVKVLWEIINNTTNPDTKKIVIVGSPGSGKTTLLKFTTLALANPKKYLPSKKPLEKLPVFITLREHAHALLNNPDLTLPNIIEIAMKRIGKEPPKRWFATQLSRGNCVVMMDGLDEIADPQARKTVVEWVKNQMVAFNKNTFIVTSRPHGYENNRLNGVFEFEIVEFTHEEVQLFINNWYLANEVMRTGRLDSGIEEKVEKQAKDLIQRLEDKPALSKLAVNPLLVTMIATVHSFKVVLPGRRVELYYDIFDVFIRRRYDEWLSFGLDREDVLKVLRLLAYHMMQNKLRDININDAVELTKRILENTKANLKGYPFFEKVNELSGLLVEVGPEQYAFAHLTFQEYLAASYIFLDRTRHLEDELIAYIEIPWWAETIRLYSAHTDATNIVEACISSNPITSHILSLAIDCVNEADDIEETIKAKYHRVLDLCSRSEDSEIRKQVAIARLSSRTRWMNRLNPVLSIDYTLVTNEEYRLFVDDLRQDGVNIAPDHWINATYAVGEEKKPVVGVRPNDALRFCQWISDRDIWGASYRIPTEKEAILIPLGHLDQMSIDDAHRDQLGKNIIPPTYWINSDSKTVAFSSEQIANFYDVEQKDIEVVLQSDLEILHSLHDALERRNQVRPTSDKLLADKIPTGGSGLKAPDVLIGSYFHKWEENESLLKKHETFAKILKLDILNLVQKSSSVFLGTKGDLLESTRWLSVTQKYSLVSFDIDSILKTVQNYLSDEQNRSLLDFAWKFYFDDLILALDHIRLRDVLETENEKNFKLFLFWYARVCAISIATFITRFRKQADSPSIKSLIKTFEHLVIQITFLEFRLLSKIYPIEGIRIVKVKT